MNEEIKYFEDRPFDNRIVEELDMRSIEAAFDEGNRCLQYQFQIIQKIKDRCTMIFGWLFVMMTAFVGFIALNWSNTAVHLAWMIVAFYSFTFCLAISIFIFSGTLYKRTIFFPGTSPSHFLQDEILKPLKGIENKSKYTMGWYLHYIQFKIMENNEEQRYLVKQYRRTLAFILAWIGSATILLIVLLLVLP